MKIEMITVQEVAARLAISVRHVHNLVARGEFPQPVHFGRAIRWPADRIEQYLAGRIEAAEKVSAGIEKRKRG